MAGAGIAWVGAKMIAQGGGGDVFVDAGEEMNARSLFGCESEWGKLRAIQKCRGEIEARAGDDDPLGEFEHSMWRTPVGKREEAVGACNRKERSSRDRANHLLEEIDRVVGYSAGMGCIERGDGEKRLSVVRCPLFVWMRSSAMRKAWMATVRKRATGTSGM